MNPRKSSKTAVGIAACRAGEHGRPAQDRICSDPYAVHFLPWRFHLIARFPPLVNYLRKKRREKTPGLYEAIVARVRYIDDFLGECAAKGLGQCVILGAGFDTRAYRVPGLAQGVRVFEVDHPATQAVKRRVLKKIFSPVPGHVTFVPVRFNSQALGTRLLESGYDPGLKTLFIWEGVIMYLTRRAVEKTLDFMANNSGPGSRVILDYIPASVLEGPGAPKEGKFLKKDVARKGEAFTFTIETKELEPFLAQHGFEDICTLTARDLRPVYFTGNNAGRPISRVLHFAHARVRQ